ncbi:hypothetical protein OJ998_04790 [Solirubrobacter taibaiensis]|nr:hypothetical protein [Solirubrobacter taibaiensis]
MRAVLRPSSPEGNVTVLVDNDHEGRLLLVDTDVGRALFVLACVSVQGGDD